MEAFTSDLKSRNDGKLDRLCLDRWFNIAGSLPTFTSHVPPPGRLELKGKLSDNWKKWKQVWDAYETVTKLNEKESKFRVATFITCIGAEALEVHNGLPFRSEDDKQDINIVLDLWNSHCIGQTNIIYERYRFNNRNQESHESIDVYATVLPRTAFDESCCKSLNCRWKSVWISADRLKPLALILGRSADNQQVQTSQWIL